MFFWRNKNFYLLSLTVQYKYLLSTLGKIYFRFSSSRFYGSKSKIEPSAFLITVPSTIDTGVEGTITIFPPLMLQFTIINQIFSRKSKKYKIQYCVPLNREHGYGGKRTVKINSFFMSSQIFQINTNLQRSAGLQLFQITTNL